MATFYIDSDNGNDTTNDGSSVTKTNGDGPWATLHKYTEGTRAAGDIAILRRGMTNRYDDGGDLVFLSDGTVVAPIVVEADYANAFGDDVDLSATATATLTFGSKTITFSADISGVLAAGDWIYTAGDDAKEFAYEVDSVSTVTVTLFLPYKGAQAGSGKTMTNMQSPPIWNTVSVAIQWNLDGDHFWKIQGIHIRGTDVNGQVELDGSASPSFTDCIFEGLGVGDAGIFSTDDWVNTVVKKCRFLTYTTGISGGGAGGFIGEVRDCLFDGNSVASGYAFNVGPGINAVFIDTEFKNHFTGDFRVPANSMNSNGTIHLRNCILSSATELDNINQSYFAKAFIEDHDGTPNDTRHLSFLSTTESTPITQSDTTKVRAGGGTISIEVKPSTDLSTVWEHSRLLLFEFPIYATTSSKTYTVYFASANTGTWTANPTAGELWIELEYWGHASNNFRRITKSTGTLDFKTDTDFDQTLTLTIAPAQAGVAYLRCYYAKTQESGKTNLFHVDPKVEIT